MKRSVPLIIIIVFVVSIIVALNSGRYPVSIVDAARHFLSGAGLTGNREPLAPEMWDVLYSIRLPRIVLALAVGAALSVSGAVFQALFRNPLASPDLLGATAGASFGAVLALLIFPPLSVWIRFSSFIFGIVAVAGTYILASKSRDRSAAVLILAGIVISAIFQAGVSIIKYLAEPYNELQKIVFWLMGSLQATTWPSIRGVLGITVICTALVTIFSWQLNLMSQEDEQALSLGVDIFKWRIFYIVITALMISVSVSTCGTIGWIGLIVPHIARYIVGAEHKKLIVTAAFLGAALMLLMDTAARSLLSSEIPISIVTSLIGAPFLGYLILSQRKGMA